MATASSCVSARPSTRESTGPPVGGGALVVGGVVGGVGAPVVAAGGAGVEAPGAVTGGGVIVPPGAGVVAGVCGVVGVGVAGGVTGAGTGVGVCGGSCASAAGAASSRHSKATTPARTIRMQRLPFPNTARAVSVTRPISVHENNTLPREEPATGRSTHCVATVDNRWTRGGWRWTTFPLTTATWRVLESATRKIWWYLVPGL